MNLLFPVMKQAIVLNFLTIAWINLAAGRNPMENPWMHDGDMLGVELDKDRNVVPDDKMLWPNGVVTFEIGNNFPSHHLKVVQDAMNYIEENTCIKFRPRNGERDFVRIFHGDSCYASWGRRGGEQFLSLGERCDYPGIALHEIMHAIGFDHEHNRPDRDEYLTIFWDNIRYSAHRAFRKVYPHETRLLTPFDYDSIMMYGSKFFVKDFNYNSMLTKDGKFIGNNYFKTNMTSSDILRVKMLYKCPDLKKTT